LKGSKRLAASAWLPMGNMAKNNELVAQPYHIDEVIEFSYKTVKEVII